MRSVAGVVGLAGAVGCASPEPVDTDGSGGQPPAPGRVCVYFPVLFESALPRLTDETWPGPGLFSTGDEVIENMALDDDGTLRRTENGTDWVGAWAMRWRVDGDAVVIEPEAGEVTFEWPKDLGVHEATSARVERIDARRVRVDVVYVNGLGEEVWETGHRCRTYCADMPPTVPCELPFDAMYESWSGEE